MVFPLSPERSNENSSEAGFFLEACAIALLNHVLKVAQSIDKLEQLSTVSMYKISMIVLIIYEKVKIFPDPSLENKLYRKIARTKRTKQERQAEIDTTIVNCWIISKQR